MTRMLLTHPTAPWALFVLFIVTDRLLSLSDLWQWVLIGVMALMSGTSLWIVHREGQRLLEEADALDRKMRLERDLPPRTG